MATIVEMPGVISTETRTVAKSSEQKAAGFRGGLRHVLQEWVALWVAILQLPLGSVALQWVR